MDNQIEQEDLFDVEVDNVAKKHISDIAIWAKIVAIAAFIDYGLSLIIAVFGQRVADESFSGSTGNGSFSANTSRAATIAGTLVVAAIGIILNIFLFKFAKDAKNGVEHIDQRRLEDGFNSLRIYFKITGILVIIVISVVVLLLLLNRGLQS